MTARSQKTRAFMRSLPILASIMGKKLGVKIQIGGYPATDGKTVYLPPLPLDGGEELFILANGYLDHESSHIRETDFEMLAKSNMDRLTHNFWNMAEDMRVERELVKVYPGCREHFRKMYESVLANYPAPDPARAGHNICTWFMLAMYSIQYPNIDFPADCYREAVEIQFPNLIRQLEAFFPSGLACDSTAEGISWARSIVAFLFQYFNKAMPKPEAGEEQKGGSPQPEENGKENETDDGNGTGQNGTEAEPREGEECEADNGGTGGGGKEQSLPAPEASDTASNNTSSAESDGSADNNPLDGGSGRQDSSDVPTQPDTDYAEAPGSEDGTDMPDTPGMPDVSAMPERRNDEDGFATSEESDQAGISSGAGAAQTASAGESNDFETINGERTDIPTGGERGFEQYEPTSADILDRLIQGEIEGDEPVDAAHKSLESTLNAGDDLPWILGDQLRELLAEISLNASETLEVAVPKGDPLGFMPKPVLIDAKGATKVMSTRLSGLLQAQVLQRIHLGRRGRIDGAGLHRLASENPRVFRRSAERQHLNTAVHILLDCSGSMADCMMLANAACYSVASALHRIRGVNVGVTAFPGEWDYNRGNTVNPILRHGQRIHTRFDAQARGGTPMGEAIWWTFQEMHSLKEERKIILVLSDGYPNSVPNTKAAIETVTEHGYEVLGIGIGEYGHYILDLIENSRAITTIEELAPAMFGVLQKALTEKGRQQRR